MSLPNPAELISQMATRLKAHLEHRGISEPRYIGIRTGGVWVAQALLDELGSDSPLGTLDVSFYRDDFSQNGLHPQVRPSALPFEIEGQHLVLIDDVLMSGRTIRAALNELFDYGRSSIRRRSAPGAGLRSRTAAPKGALCLLYTSPSPRDLSTSRMPSSA